MSSNNTLPISKFVTSVKNIQAGAIYSRDWLEYCFSKSTDCPNLCDQSCVTYSAILGHFNLKIFSFYLC